MELVNSFSQGEAIDSLRDRNFYIENYQYGICFSICAVWIIRLLSVNKERGNDPAKLYSQESCFMDITGSLMLNQIIFMQAALRDKNSSELYQMLFTPDTIDHPNGRFRIEDSEAYTAIYANFFTHILDMATNDHYYVYPEFAFQPIESYLHNQSFHAIRLNADKLNYLAVLIYLQNNKLTYHTVALSHFKRLKNDAAYYFDPNKGLYRFTTLGDLLRTVVAYGDEPSTTYMALFSIKETPQNERRKRA